MLDSTGFTATCFSRGRTEKASEVHTMPLKWERGSYCRNRSHSSFPGVSYGPQSPWDLSTIVPNHHCSRTSSSTTLVHCNMCESHCPVDSVPRGINGAIVGQQQEATNERDNLGPQLSQIHCQSKSASYCCCPQPHSGSQWLIRPLASYPSLQAHTTLHEKSDTKSNKTK